MKPIIIRKPKFMRNDIGMWAYLKTASTISNEACRPELTPEQHYEFLKKAGVCLNKAAEAGGFRNAGDMHKWLESQKTT